MLCWISAKRSNMKTLTSTLGAGKAGDAGEGWIKGRKMEGQDLIQEVQPASQSKAEVSSTSTGHSKGS